MRLMNKVSLTITRYEPTKGNWTSDGRWVETVNSTTPTFNILCNIQPFRQGNESSILPQGTKSTDAFIVYTNTEIKTISQFDFEQADSTIIKGHKYIAFDVMDWNLNGLRLDHYKILFIREDKLTNGSI